MNTIVHAGPRQDSYDVVVVGSGIGGVSAAALLARAGMKVLLVEAHDAPGGYVHSFQRGPYTFDPAVHLVVDPPMFDRMLTHIGVRDRVKFLQPPNFYSFATRELQFHAPFGKEAFIETHVEHFPEHEQSIRQFFDVCAQVHREAHELPSRVSLSELDALAAQLPTLFKYRKSTVAEVMDEYLTDPKVRAACGAASLYLGIPASALSFQTFAQMIFSHVVNGANYVEGGVQVLVDAYVAGLEQHGGEIVFGHPVSKILVEDGKVAGVALENGQQVRASTVISNADTIQTFERLVGLEHLPAPFVRNYKRLKVSISGFMVLAVTSQDVRPYDPGHLTFYSKTWYPEETYQNTLNGRPESMVIAMPTLVDPTLAPPGEHQVILVTFVHYDIGRPWREARDGYTDGLMGEVEALYPGVRANLTFQEAATPVTLERFTLNHRGAIYGWENTPDQAGSKRPSQVTPIDGLYLVGSWTQPGGGFVRAIGSAVLTSQLVLNRANAGVEIPRFMSA